MSQGIILVPLDGSKNAELAVPTAARLARATGAKVRFVHVVEADSASADAIRKTEEQFAGYAAGLAEHNGLGAGEREAALLRGPAAKEILAASADAQCIVIASHGRGGMKATLVGSVADKVVRGAQVPVYFVPSVKQSKALEGGSIVVALDGSEEAEVGLAAARDVARLAGGQVVLVRAFTVPAPVGVEFAYYPPDLTETLQQAAEEYLAKTAREGEQTMLLQGAAALAIEEAANKLDAALVVVTSHGKGLAARIALGSTTDRLMHSLQRPMLIVPLPEA